MERVIILFDFQDQYNESGIMYDDDPKLNVSGECIENKKRKKEVVLFFRVLFFHRAAYTAPYT